MYYILPCKYPTTTLLLDDNESFLESLKILINKPQKNLVLTTNPVEAFKIIKDFSTGTKDLNLETKEESGQGVNYSKVCELVRNPYRSEEISVLVVDYYMPEINGIEFCHKIKTSKCQKILLTASNDQSIAVQAFNQGLIQQYICKQDRNVDELLINAIKEAEERFLVEKFNQMIPSEKHKNVVFKNKNLQNFLINYIKNNNINEYYVFNNNGDLFCVDTNGITSKIFIRTKEELQIPLTWQEADCLPYEALVDVRACRKMLCISIDQEDFPPVNLWFKYLAPTVQIPNEPNYFISILKDQTL